MILPEIAGIWYLLARIFSTLHNVLGLEEEKFLPSYTNEPHFAVYESL